MSIIIKNISDTNPTGLCRISLIHKNAIEHFRVINALNFDTKLEIAFNKEKLQAELTHTDFKTNRQNAQLAYSGINTPAGTLYDISLTIQVQSAHPEIHKSLKQNLPINSHHILYVVYNNGNTYLINDFDNPIRLVSIQPSQDEAFFAFTFQGSSSFQPLLLKREAQPHFFTPSSHTLDNNFYNFD